MFNTVPISILVTMIIVLLIFSVTVFKTNQLTSMNFLSFQIISNLTIIIIISFFFGTLVDSFEEESFVKKNAYLILPVILVVFMFLKTFVIYADALRTTCALRYEKETGEMPTKSRQNNTILLLNTIKMILTISSVYTILMFLPSLTKPFYEVFSSDHKTIHYIAIGFWIGCACMPAETSIYFSVLRSGCQAVANIQFKSSSEVLENEEDKEDKEDKEDNNLSTETNYD